MYSIECRQRYMCPSRPKEVQERSISSSFISLPVFWLHGGYQSCLGSLEDCGMSIKLILNDYMERSPAQLLRSLEFTHVGSLRFQVVSATAVSFILTST